MDKKNDEINADNILHLFKNKNEEKRERKNPNDNLASAPYADVYKMDHSRRGTAIIFNHEKFSNPNCSNRDGSFKDKNDLTEILHELDFDVLAYDDLTFFEIKDVLKNVAQMDHSDSDCFLLVVMSHGDNGKLYAKDQDYPTKILWKYLDTRSCPSLAGKPKLIFIQACRGVKVHPGHVLQYQIETDADATENAFYTIPAMADILIMYSTVEGFYSWRDPLNGGYFTQSLVKQLRAHHSSKDLLTILTFVNREVAIEFTSHNPDAPKLSGSKQMCSIVSMLTRQLYFTKK